MSFYSEETQTHQHVWPRARNILLDDEFEVIKFKEKKIKVKRKFSEFVENEFTVSKTEEKEIKVKKGLVNLLRVETEENPDTNDLHFGYAIYASRWEDLRQHLQDNFVEIDLVSVIRNSKMTESYT
ncbi:hypothetical protein C1646_756254 [Rhizophagus diaphanus]|nr:hypothetical protein C1646_756254 [Rhizophagus diaphanus] [Rhizophagus sp. MUCL 43196]